MSTDELEAMRKALLEQSMVLKKAQAMIAAHGDRIELLQKRYDAHSATYEHLIYGVLSLLEAGKISEAVDVLRGHCNAATEGRAH